METVRRLKRAFFKRIKILYYLSNYNYTDSELVIITGADSTHYKSLNQFLSSLYTHEPVVSVVVVDLGLTQLQKQCIRDRFPLAEFRLFDYSKYPDYFNIKVNAGEYAWKPVIFREILNEFKCSVCWMDAGNIITKPLFYIRRITQKIGMYSPYSSGCISDWTHPKTLKYLNVPNVLFNKPNLNGACIAVDYQNSKARNIVNQWGICAMERDCIAPAGSNKSNHRQDQAVLSVLAHQSGITKNMPGSILGFKIHQDIG